LLFSKLCPSPLLLVFVSSLGWWSCGGSGSNVSVNNNPPSPNPNPQSFSCPAGREDVMQYFALSQQYRGSQFMDGQPNPIYTQVYPSQDFASSGYWFWLKSSSAQGFDVKAFDQNYVYIRSTELTWTDNTTFKRFVRDLPISSRCVDLNQAGPEIQVSDTTFQYFASCGAYKSSQLGTSLNDLDAPALLDAAGDIGQVMTRILHYRYNCDASYQNCRDEEQFFLAKDLGLWQWIHSQSGTVVKSSLMNNLTSGTTNATLPCETSY
jgi:hypothetical protein